MVEVFQHAALAYYIAHALGPYNCDTASAEPGNLHNCVKERTFVFSNVLECVCRAIVFSFNDAHLAKCALPDDA